MGKIIPFAAVIATSYALALQGWVCTSAAPKFETCGMDEGGSTLYEESCLNALLCLNELDPSTNTTEKNFDHEACTRHGKRKIEKAKFEVFKRCEKTVIQGLKDSETMEKLRAMNFDIS